MSTQADVQPVKGSWEALLEEAQRMVANQNDDAIPALEKIVTRLRRIPRTQRLAANRRLQNIWMQAAVDLMAYLTMRERYPEALAVIDQIQEEVDPEEQLRWRNHAAAVLLQAGRGDDAIAAQRALAERAESDLESWGDLAITLYRLKRYAEAETVLARMDEWVAEHHSTDSEGARRDAGYVLGLRSLLKLEEGDVDAAIELVNRAIELDHQYVSRLALIYVRLIREEQYDVALPLIRRDQRSPVRAMFWQGVVLARQGRQQDAEALWRKIMRHDMEQDDVPAFMEYILAAFYLRDPDGEGLKTLLNILSEDTSQYWPVYFLVGLGWAQRGNLNNARSDLEAAMLRRRSSAEGRLLPYESWAYCLDLLDDATRDAIAEYFETDPDA